MKSALFVVVALSCLLATCAEEWEEPEYLDDDPSSSMRFLETSAIPEDIRHYGAPPNPISFVPPLVRGVSPPAGNYFPPVQPYRFPSYPYDNPSYTPAATMVFVPLPPAWRSDALNILSDGGRYLQSMSSYDFYGGGGGHAQESAAPAA